MLKGTKVPSNSWYQRIRPSLGSAEVYESVVGSKSLVTIECGRSPRLKACVRAKSRSVRNASVPICQGCARSVTGGSPRIHAGEERFSAPEGVALRSCALALAPQEVQPPRQPARRFDYGDF